MNSSENSGVMLAIWIWFYARRLAKPDMSGTRFEGSLAAWLRQLNVKIVHKISLNLRAATGTVDWYLVKLN